MKPMRTRCVAAVAFQCTETRSSIVRLKKSLGTASSAFVKAWVMEGRTTRPQVTRPDDRRFASSEGGSAGEIAALR